MIGERVVIKTFSMDFLVTGLDNLIMGIMVNDISEKFAERNLANV